MFCGCFRGTYVQLPSVRVRFQIYTGVPSRRGAGPYRWVTRARAMPAPRRTRRWPGNSRRRRPAPADRAGRPTGWARARRCARRASGTSALHTTPAPRRRRRGRTRRPSRARCRRCARRRPRQRPPGGRPREASFGSIFWRANGFSSTPRRSPSPPGQQSASARGATQQSAKWAPQPWARGRGGDPPRGEASPQALDGRAARGRGGLGRRRSDAPEAPVARIEGASAGSSTQ